MGREKQVSFRATGWHVDRLNDLRGQGVADGDPPRSMSAVIRDTITLLWEHRHPKKLAGGKGDV